MRISRAFLVKSDVGVASTIKIMIRGLPEAASQPILEYLSPPDGDIKIRAATHPPEMKE